MFVSKSTLIALIPFLLPATTQAANDWSVPCLKGSCSWDTGDGVKEAWSTLTVDGSPNSISDITNAAGWEILGCDGKTTQPQDIRIVCTNPDAGCESLFAGGAENTLVRLPNWCGPGPFARVTKTWVHEDQSIPPKVAKKMKRALTDPAHPVQGLRFDFDLKSVPESKGPVSFMVSSTGNPRQRGVLDGVTKRDFVTVRHGRSHIAARGFFDSFKDKVGDVIDKGKEVAGDAKDALKDAGGKVIDAGSKVIDKVEDVASDVNNFDQNFNKDFPPAVVNKKDLVLIDTTINCPPSLKGGLTISAGLKIKADVDLNAQVSMGFLVKGSIVPPKLDDMLITGSLTSKANMKFNIQANAKGDFDTLKIPFFSLGIPGLNIPGVITLGPKLTLNTQLIGKMDVLANMNVTAAWDVEKLSLTFPPEKGKSSAEVKPKDTPIDIGMLGADVDSKSSVEVHLIPRVDFGIDALGGTAKATVFLDVDGFGKMDLNLLAASSKAASGKKLGGCTNLGVGVDITAGATGSILPFFSKTTSVDLFNKKKDIFTKCFGDQVGQEEEFRKTKGAKAVDTPPTGDVANSDADVRFEAVDEAGNPLLDAQGNIVLTNEAGDAFFDQEGNPIDAPAGAAPPTEEIPVEETPAEETPAEETPAEETPAEETPAEETPAGTEEGAAEAEPETDFTPADQVVDDGSLFEAIDESDKPILDKSGNPLLVDANGAFFDQTGAPVEDSAIAAKRSLIVSEHEFEKRQLLDQLKAFIPQLVCPGANPKLAFQGIKNTVALSAL